MRFRQKMPGSFQGAFRNRGKTLVSTLLPHTELDIISLAVANGKWVFNRTALYSFKGPDYNQHIGFFEKLKCRITLVWLVLVKCEQLDDSVGFASVNSM